MPSPRYRPRLRIGVIGFAHMHINALIEDFLATGRADLVACADTVPRTPSLTQVEGSRRANLARALAHPDRPRHHADHLEMLDTEQLDLVLFCPEIARHAEIAEAIAARGLPMVTEKPMAATSAAAARMTDAAARANVALVTNWPTTWRPPIRRVKKLLEAGAIGDVLQFRWRNLASTGPLAAGSLHPGDTTISGTVTDAEKSSEWWHRSAEGGGALLDYCCYGACLATWFLGRPPDSVQAMTHNLRHRFGDAEDNATLLLRYPDATGLIDASWTTLHAGVPNGPILHGTLGTIVVDGPRVLLYRERPATTPNATAPTQVFDNERLEGPATIAEAVLAHLETGAPLHPTLAPPLNRTVASILEAGARAAAAGTTQPVE